MLGSMPIDTLMDPDDQFDQNLGNALEDPGRYHIWIGKLIYLLLSGLNYIYC